MTAIQIQLPDAERGLGKNEIKRLDRLYARLIRADITQSKRDAIRTELERLETAPREAQEARWRQDATDETIRLATLRNEAVEAQPARLRIWSRDPLLHLARKGHLTPEQHDSGIACRDAYELRFAGLSSQLGAQGGSAHNNDRFVLISFYNAKRLQRLHMAELEIMARSLVGLMALRHVCGDGRTVTSMGSGRLFQRNIKALQLALDVAAPIMVA